MVLNYIDFDGTERRFSHNCVDELLGRGKSDTLKKVGYITMYGTYESEEDKE